MEPHTNTITRRISQNIAIVFKVSKTLFYTFVYISHSPLQYQCVRALERLSIASNYNSQSKQERCDEEPVRTPS